MTCMQNKCTKHTSTGMHQAVQTTYTLYTLTKLGCFASLSTAQIDKLSGVLSAVTLLDGRQEGHLACNKLGVVLLVVTIWLELCMSYITTFIIFSSRMEIFWNCIIQIHLKKTKMDRVERNLQQTLTSSASSSSAGNMVDCRTNGPGATTVLTRFAKSGSMLCSSATFTQPTYYCQNCQ